MIIVHAGNCNDDFQCSCVLTCSRSFAVSYVNVQLLITRHILLAVAFISITLNKCCIAVLPWNRRRWWPWSAFCFRLSSLIWWLNIHMHIFSDLLNWSKVICLKRCLIETFIRLVDLFVDYLKLWSFLFLCIAFMLLCLWSMNATCRWQEQSSADGADGVDFH